MTSQTTFTELLTHLDELEAELKVQQLWSAQPPSAQALESTMPFMYDTLQLHEWLQWVFLPRLRAVVEQQGQLPCQSQIHALAEHEWQQRRDFDKTRLLVLLERVDLTLNEGPLTRDSQSSGSQPH